MTKSPRNQPYIRTPRTERRLQRIVTGLILGGSLLAATAIVISVPDEEAQAAKPIPAQAEARPEWAQTFEAVDAISQPQAVVEAGEPEIITDVHAIEAAAAEAEAPAPKTALSLPHSDKVTDFAAKANRHLDEGDLKAALTAMRHHIHDAEATQDELFTIGTLARQTKDLALAEAALEQAIEVGPDRAGLHTELARVHMKDRDYPAARAEARKAVRLDRDNPGAWNALGRIAMAESQWEQAEMAYRHALELDPTNPMYHNNAGLLYIYMKRGLDAVDALETAVELYEDEAPHFVFNNLGLAHEMAGQFEESREAFEEALLLNPFYSRAKVNLQRIEDAIAKAEENSAFQTAQGVTAAAATTDGT